MLLTGLSGSGKSTVAYHLEHQLTQRGQICIVLDGDNMRHGLNSDLGFTPRDRVENVRRLGYVATTIASNGGIAVVAAIAPDAAARNQARQIAADHNCPFLEVFLDVGVDVCAQRDPKGLYRKAMGGAMTSSLTGTTAGAPYERPEAPDVVLEGNEKVNVWAERLIRVLGERGIVRWRDRGRRAATSAGTAL